MNQKSNNSETELVEKETNIETNDKETEDKPINLDNYKSIEYNPSDLVERQDLYMSSRLKKKSLKEDRLPLEEYNSTL